MSTRKPPYTLFRSRRRTASLEVSRQGELIVRVPYHLSTGTIEGLIARHQDWIKNKQTLMIERTSSAPRKAFIDGESFPYLGKEYPLSITGEGETWSLRLIHGVFSLPAGALPNAQAHFVTWYRQQAREVCRNRVAYFTDLLGVTCRNFIITGTKGVWGSCSPKGKLRFTWHLVLTPPELVDYVIAHEICHIMEHNHSKQFWSLVAGLLPDYRDRRKRLREYEYLLTIFS